MAAQTVSSPYRTVPHLPDFAEEPAIGDVPIGRAVENLLTGNARDSDRYGGGD